MTRLHAAVLVCVFGFSGAGATVAQSATPDARGACTEDYKKFCAGIAPGHGIVACLNKQHAKLSTTCRAVIDARKH